MDEAQSDFYSFSAPLPDGSVVSMAQFRGRVLLIVNTASQCGFTPQYAGLEALYRSYRPRGFEVLAFPSNQFGGQEPGTDREIGTFCRHSFGVSFPIFAKADVNGPAALPLFRYLQQRKRGFLGLRAIRWNFTKFLVDRQGNVVARYSSAKDPKALGNAIEALLAQP
jgi:glutathione peroxidase